MNTKLIVAAVGVVLILGSLVAFLVTSLGKGKKKQKPAKSQPKQWNPVAPPASGQSAGPAGGAVAKQPLFQHTVVMDGGAQPDAPGELCVLRYTGQSGWPSVIQVRTDGDGAFTIGRVDITVGRPLSSYEFPPESKAVSRKHATIFRDEEGYIIRDEGSKAGTFVNGVKLETGTLYRLRDGYQVSFGTAGADYLWEEGGQG